MRDIDEKGSAGRAVCNAFREVRYFMMITNELTEDATITDVLVDADFDVARIVDELKCLRDHQEGYFAARAEYDPGRLAADIDLWVTRAYYQKSER